MIKDKFIRRVGVGRLGRPKIVNGAAALAGALACAVAVGVAPAHADIYPNDRDRVYAQCPKRNVCVWQDSNYWGKFVRQVGGVPRPQVGSFLNDQISALWNRTNYRVCMYQNEFYSGYGRGFLPNESHHDLQNDKFTFDDDLRAVPDGPRMNDRISSWRACAAGTP